MCRVSTTGPSIQFPHINTVLLLFLTPSNFKLICAISAFNNGVIKPIPTSSHAGNLCEKRFKCEKVAIPDFKLNDYPPHLSFGL